MSGESEAETRENRIDKAILVAGWKQILPYEKSRTYGTAAVEEHPTSSGPSDYVLYHRSIPLAIVEAK
jgi:type I site-specific restriction endonuclease